MDLSQRELGERVGAKQQVVANWESGTSNPKLKDLLALADAFGTTTDDLLGRPTKGRLKVSVEAAIAADPDLSTASRRALLAAYRAAVDLPG